jgi:aminoglycoside phosphotransferase (APT) family kinase protein
MSAATFDKDLFLAYGIVEGAQNLIPIQNGLIHQSFLLADFSRLSQGILLQQINLGIFREPSVLWSNFQYLSDVFFTNNASFELPKWVLNINNSPWTLDEKGDFWRAWRYVPHCTEWSVQSMLSYAKIIAELHSHLSRIESVRLEPAIPDFLNFQSRIESFHSSVKEYAITFDKDVLNLIEKCSELCDFISENEKLSAPDALFYGLIHGDTKPSNLLIPPDRGSKPVLIDWDTLMPGPIWYDFGDLIRALFFEQKEQDLILTMKSYIKIEEAYLSALSITQTHVFVIDFRKGVCVVTAVQALRFLSDYLSGSHYYKVSYPEENLDRAIRHYQGFICLKTMLL